jgi:VWFA-related protein
MRRWGIGLSVLPPIAAIVLASVETSARQVSFRTTVGTVVVDVAVRQDGQPVLGLTASDFRLTDNGVRQTITGISHDALPIDITLIADISRMRDGPLLDAFRRAIERVLEQRRSGDRARLVLFDPRIREVEFLASNTLSIEAERGVSPDTATALLDAVAVSLVRPSDPARRRMAILFSNGRDGGSFLDEAGAVDVAARSGVTVFTVALTDGTTRTPLPPARPGLLRALAGTTGGVLTVLQRDQDLTPPFVNALHDFRMSYVLHYTPTGVPAGGWHDLDVQLERPGRYDVRARRGYFGDAGTAAR